MKNIFKKIILYIFLLLISLGLVIFFINYYILSFSKKNYYNSVDKLEKKEIGIVFGASVKGGQPSLILKDRLDVAFEAYEKGKIEKIIVSGDNSIVTYNEPFVMKKYLLSLGVKKEDIYEDFAGFDTYDSLYRAKDIFKVNELVLFTQDFHLKRAIYIAEKLGIKAYGVSTDLRKYLRPRYNYYREIFARVKAFVEIEITKPKPKFLGDTIKIVSNEEINEIKKTLKGEELEDFLKNFSGSFEENFE